MRRTTAFLKGGKLHIKQIEKKGIKIFNKVIIPTKERDSFNDLDITIEGLESHINSMVNSYKSDNKIITLSIDSGLTEDTFNVSKKELKEIIIDLLIMKDYFIKLDEFKDIYWKTRRGEYDNEDDLNAEYKEVLDEILHLKNIMRIRNVEDAIYNKKELKAELENRFNLCMSK